MAGGEKPLTEQDAALRATLVRHPRYRIGLSLDNGDQQATFSSVTEVDFEANTGAATFIDLAAASVEAIELNGRAVNLSAFSEGRVRLDNLGEHNHLVIRAHCLYRGDGMGMERNIDPADGRTYLFTQGEAFEAHRYFANFDQPDIKGVYTFAVDAPEEWVVASNSLIDTVSAVAGGRRMWSFAPTQVMASYVATVVAGPYHRVTENHRGIPLGLYCRQSMVPYLDPAGCFEIIKQGLDFFENYFGVPYPFAKWEQAFVTGFTFGAMENPGIVTYSDAVLFQGTPTPSQLAHRASIHLHEMAHMWTGNLVTMKWWNDICLNESFAPLLAMLAQDAATRYKSAAIDFANGAQASATAADQLSTSHPVAGDISNTDVIWEKFDRLTYEKGAAVLKQLATYVGETAFKRGLHTYLVEYSFGNATLDDLLRHLAAASGRDLQRWSAVWMKQPGVNVLCPRVQTAPDGTITEFVVEQRAAVAAMPTLRPHRIAIGLYDYNQSGDLVRRGEPLLIDVDGPATRIAALENIVRPALILVNDGDLTYAKTELDPMSMATLLRSIGRVVDPMARSVCNSVAWNMVRDAKLSAADYLEVVLQQTANTDATVLEELVARANKAIRAFADPSLRGEVERRACTAYRALLAAAAPGSSEQTVWLRAFVATASNPVDLAYLRRLLDGTDLLPGVRIRAASAELEDHLARWNIVARLAGMGRLTPADIEAERRRDPSEDGQVQAAAARAACPTRVAKDWAWLKLSDGNLSIKEIKAIGGAFWQVGQEALLAPYLAKMPATVEHWVKDLPAQTVRTLVAAAFPLHDPSPRAVRMIDQLLPRIDAKTSVYRWVTEHRENIIRAQHAREFDRVANSPGLALVG